MAFELDARAVTHHFCNLPHLTICHFGGMRLRLVFGKTGLPGFAAPQRRRRAEPRIDAPAQPTARNLAQDHIQYFIHRYSPMRFDTRG